MKLFEIFFNKRYGKKYLIINVITVIIPFMYSLITNGKAGKTGLILLVIYILSYVFAYHSYNQNRQVKGRIIDANIPLKAATFVLGSLITLLFAVVPSLSGQSIDVLYIYAVSFIFPLLNLYKLLIAEEIKNENVIKFWDKVKYFLKEAKSLVFKEYTGFPILNKIIGQIFTILVIILFLLASTIVFEHFTKLLFK